MIDLALPPRCIHCDEACRHDVGFSVWKRMRQEPFCRTLDTYLCDVCERVLLTSEPPSSKEITDRVCLTNPELPLRYIAALRNFIKDGVMQSLIHAMKYQDMPKLGAVLSHRLAAEMIRRESLELEFVDVILPVPLHRTRLSTRGYNQAEKVAQGVARALDRPIRSGVTRVRPTETQTTLDLTARLANVRGAFRVNARRAKAIQNKHVLIVDDVLTTGATLTAVAEALLECRPASLSLLAMAAATKTDANPAEVVTPGIK